jgi:ATP-dependent helicase HrpA
VTEVRWMLEELRVSLFAQTLGTLTPVSETRILAALSRLRPLGRSGPGGACAA